MQSEIIGIDSGDLSSSDSYKGNECNAYWGEALIIIKKRWIAGTDERERRHPNKKNKVDRVSVTLIAQSDGLKEGRIQF